jgi:hypothetical protein
VGRFRRSTQNRVHGGLDPVLDLELGENARDVVPHCVDADEQLLGDLRVLLALRYQAEYIVLPLG